MKRLAAVLLVLTLLAGCTVASSNVGAAPESAHTHKTTTFGKYQGQAIEWYVLDQTDGRSLLLSVHALDSRPFSDRPATWATSSLRSWLNADFYNQAFTASERSNILLSKLQSKDDLKYGTTAGSDTEDHVFLLSASEAQKYLSGDETSASPTEYALSRGAYTNERGDCAWWLRSPGMNNEGPAYYSSQGTIGSRAHEGSESIIGIRPVIWVKKSALN